MKNKFEGYCYVCGEVVPELQGLAEQRPRKRGDPGWGETTWSVRHKTCTPPPENQDPKQADDSTKA